MEFSIRVLVVILLIVIAFVVFVALLAGWFGDAAAGVKSLNEWFSQLLKGGLKPADTSTGSTGIPGIGKT